MLAVYRVGVAIPTPGIDGQALAVFFEQASSTVFGLVNLFSGGALERFSIFALGIMPYISASIILQLLTVVVPALERLSKEGEVGRRKITEYTRYGTVGLALLQGFFISMGLEQIRTPSGGSVIFDPGWSFRIMTMITLTSGTAFIMWLGEQITERGIGNGISLIIFAGIVASIPSAITSTIEFVREGEIGCHGGRAHRDTDDCSGCGGDHYGARTPTHSRTIRKTGRWATHVRWTKFSPPTEINTAGVIPPIFASSILVFPTTIAGFSDSPWAKTAAELLAPGSWLYNLSYVALIIFFCYFYTAVVFNPTDVADNMKKNGGFIPGIRPGQRTAEYLDRILSRVTLSGALYISVVCILPTLLIGFFNVPFFFGGTALLIVVGVALDTAAQIETQVLMRNYEGFMKRGRIRGRTDRR